MLKGELEPLHYAAEHQHIESVALLLSAKARVDGAEHCACTPLHIAADKGHRDVAALLLGASASVDAIDSVP